MGLEWLVEGEIHVGFASRSRRSPRPGVRRRTHGLRDSGTIGRVTARNGEHGYGWVTKSLHWLTVAALIAQFVVGYLMEDEGGHGRGRGRGRGGDGSGTWSWARTRWW